MKTPALIALIVLFGGCELEGEDEEGEGTVEDSTCLSGFRWAGGNEESPLMHPGGDCIGCHAAEREGPSYAIAGTVHAALDEPADCFGVDGAVVTITDANDQVFELTTNSAGNFFLSESAGVALPFRATVSYDGNEISMATPQQTGACATCHTESGLNGAPGRVLAP